MSHPVPSSEAHEVNEVAHSCRIQRSVYDNAQSILICCGFKINLLISNGQKRRLDCIQTWRPGQTTRKLHIEHKSIWWVSKYWQKTQSENSIKKIEDIKWRHHKHWNNVLPLRWNLIFFKHSSGIRWMSMNFVGNVTRGARVSSSLVQHVSGLFMRVA